MPCGVWKITDVPTNKIGGVEDAFNAEDPTSVVTTPQGEGKWTVTATWPACNPPEPPKVSTFSG